MKRTVLIVLAVSVLMAMLGCSAESSGESSMENTETIPVETTAAITECYDATESDKAVLEAAYNGRTPFYGEMHDHSNSGGKSDGRMTLPVWRNGLMELGMDFATIVDHKQVRHMLLPEWDETMFIGGTEAATWVKDLDLEENGFHYNMVFTDHETLMEILEEFGFNFSGTELDGSFPRYPRFTRAELESLVKAIQDKGGMFVHVHPKHAGCLDSENPLDYWYGDWTGIEVMNTYKSDRNGPNTQKNYQLWVDLLALGKKVWATSGNDGHGMPTDKAASTVYAEERLATSYFSHIRVGDFTCGPVGIRMAVGDARMGSECDFTGKRLVFSVGDFHKSVLNPYHTYRVDLISDSGVVFTQEISCEKTSYFALDAENVSFYRVEVWDTTDNSRIGIGNPIWNQ